MCYIQGIRSYIYGEPWRPWKDVHVKELADLLENIGGVDSVMLGSKDGKRVPIAPLSLDVGQCAGCDEILHAICVGVPW
jgi:hypothetical protein